MHFVFQSGVLMRKESVIRGSRKYGAAVITSGEMDDDEKTGNPVLTYIYEI